MKEQLIYLSHPIRGNKEFPTEEDIYRNCRMAKEIAKQLRKRMRTDLYVPGEQDLFPQTAMRMGLLDVNQVLAIDLEIINHCIAVAYVAGPDIPTSEGMKLELAHAREQGIPIIRVDCEQEGGCWKVRGYKHAKVFS